MVGRKSGWGESYSSHRILHISVFGDLIETRYSSPEIHRNRLLRHNGAIIGCIDYCLVNDYRYWYV